MTSEVSCGKGARPLPASPIAQRAYALPKAARTCLHTVMLGVLNHPRLTYEWFTTALLRWTKDGLVIYDRWVLNFSGISMWTPAPGGEVLLDFYYLCYLIAFIGVLFWFHRYRKQGWLKIQKHVPYDTLLLAMIGVLVGAKTAYIFIYNPDFYFGPPPYGPVDTQDQLRRIFLNWSGMASHGAAFGVLFMALVWWLKSRPPIAQIGDVGAISSAFGAAWIRLANFMNGELYGRASDLPWAMRFPVRSGKGYQVVFNGADKTLYERMPKPAEPEQARVWLENLQQANPGGVIDQGGSVLYRNPDAYLQSHELMFQSDEGLKFINNQADADQLFFGVFDVVTTPRHPSQLYQMILEGVLVLIFLLWFRRRVKRAGMVAGAFFTAYPLARFIGEFFRQPDVQFQAAGNELGTVFLGLSMGQILSLVMAGAGLTMLIYFSRFGKVIADQKMWPPEKPADDGKKKLTVPFETGMGGSTGAGNFTGLDKVREALTAKEKEWDERDTRLRQQSGADPEAQAPASPAQNGEYNDDDGAEPKDTERRD